jgi:hypothetical protein
MKISPSEKDKTKNINLSISDIPDRVYIDNKIWVSTSFGEVKVGVTNGAIYHVVGDKLQRIS